MHRLWMLYLECQLRLLLWMMTVSVYYEYINTYITCCLLVLTINFVSSTYNYDEDHGLVFNIELRNSHEIAQDVEVFYSGGTKDHYYNRVCYSIVFTQILRFKLV